ncbi:uncharacterized protein LOC142554709 [Primulina tabacum]|uniref:uncharacterized protein LOC142554709 n=1 Tax=Primulina tabacum TaxID=48773 RepID=UPI003F5A04A3
MAEANTPGESSSVTTSNFAPNLIILNPSNQINTTKLIDDNFLLWQLQVLAGIRGLGLGIQSQMIGCSSSAQIWIRVSTLFATRSKARMMQYKLQLQTLKKGSLSMKDYLGKMKNYVDSLSVCGHPISDDDQVLYILGGVGMEYDSVVVHVASRGESISPSEVGALLLSHEGRIESYTVNVDGTMPTANISTFTPAKGRPSSSSPSSPSRGRGRGRFMRGGRRSWSNSNTRPICQICGYSGHITEKCYHRFDKKFISQARPSGNPYSNSYRSKPEASPTAAVAVANSEGLNDDWWFPDSGASHHVTNDLANLALGSEYIGGGKVLMGNGTEQIGVVERKNSHIVDVGISLLAHAHIPLKIWDDAFSTAVFLINRLPNSAIQRVAPLKQLSNLDPDYSLLRVFGSSSISPTNEQPVPLPTNVHSMVTRSKAGIYKPWVYTSQLMSDHESTTKHDDVAHPAWCHAMKAEYNSLIQNKTWVLVPAPTNTPIIGCKWVFKIKRHPDGTMAWYKARLVAKGCSQTAGLDYTKTFSTVIKPTTIRVVLNIALSYGWSIQQLDVDNAFLNGIEVSRPSSTSQFLSQSKYIHDLLKKTYMDNAKSLPTPMVSGLKLSSKDTEPFSDATLYRSTVGALQYLTITRPEIAFNVNKVCQFVQSPCLSHWKAVKRILRYLNGTSNHGLHLTAASRLSLHGFCDADWANDPDDKRSTSGFCWFLCSSPITWSSKKQSVVSRSSTEAEYRSLANATSELLWLKSLLTELHVPSHASPILWCDNNSTISLTANVTPCLKTRPQGMPHSLIIPHKRILSL